MSVGRMSVDICLHCLFSCLLQESELAELLASARKVKVIGSGMSWSGVQLGDGGVLVSLSQLNATIHSVERHKGGDALVTVGAGIMIRALCEELGDRYHLALANLGATASQTISGATHE